MSKINPVYYQKGKIEVIDFIADQKLNYLEGNCIKYICRYKFKNGLEDGEGILTYSDGDMHVGEFKNGKKHGQGIMTYADGSKYDQRSLEYTIPGQVDISQMTQQWVHQK